MTIEQTSDRLERGLSYIMAKLKEYVIKRKTKQGMLNYEIIKELYIDKR